MVNWLKAWRSILLLPVAFLMVLLFILILGLGLVTLGYTWRWIKPWDDLRLRLGEVIFWEKSKNGGQVNETCDRG